MLSLVIAQPTAVVEEDALTLEHLALAFKNLPLEALIAAHGNAFLFHVGPLDPARQPQGSLRTMSYTPTDPGPASAGFLASSLVFPILQTNRSPIPDFVSIGRVRNNDIIITELSISKFHAYLRVTEAGYVIQDAGSSNGTSIDGRPLAGKESRRLELNSALRLGGVDLSYIDAAALHRLLTRL